MRTFLRLLLITAALTLFCDYASAQMKNVYIYTKNQRSLTSAIFAPT